MAGKTKANTRGKMRPFTRDQLQLIRASLQAQAAVRDLALLNVAVDTMLRGGDLVRLKVSSVQDANKQIVDNVAVVQDKTKRAVYVQFTPRTCESLRTLIVSHEKWSDDYLFTAARDHHGPHLSEVAFRQIVKGWAKIVRADPRYYSGHSLRRTKASIVYKETKNIEVVRQLLGHGSLTHTIEYLDINRDDVANVALKFDV